MRSVASGTPTTAGMPYSRATTAPCDIIPPISITSALAVRKSGVHPGSVEGATSTSPGSSFAPAGERMTRATPRAVPGEAAAPRIAPSGIGGRERHLGVRAVGEQDARDTAAPELSLVLRASHGDDLAHVLTADGAAQLGYREEPHIVRRSDPSLRRELGADRQEDLAQTSEDADDLELRHLAKAGQRASAPEEEAHQPASRTMHAGRERLDHRVRRLRAARELDVGRERGGVQALVVRERADDVRGILGPARQPEIDLGDRAMAVPLEERAEPSLKRVG